MMWQRLLKKRSKKFMSEQKSVFFSKVLGLFSLRCSFTKHNLFVDFQYPNVIDVLNGVKLMGNIVSASADESIRAPAFELIADVVKFNYFVANFS